MREESALKTWISTDPAATHPIFGHFVATRLRQETLPPPGAGRRGGVGWAGGLVAWRLVAWRLVARKEN